MGTTTTHAIRYPDSTSNVNLWTHYQNLADDVDLLLTSRVGVVIARWTRTTTKQRTAAGAEVGVARIDNIPFKAGIYYTCETNALALNPVSGELGVAKFRLATGGATATTASAQIGAAQGGASSATLAALVNSPILIAEYAPGADTVGSVLLTLDRQSGSGDVFMLGSATQPIIMMIKAWGKAVAASGTDI